MHIRLKQKSAGRDFAFRPLTACAVAFPRMVATVFLQAVSTVSHPTEVEQGHHLSRHYPRRYRRRHFAGVDEVVFPFLFRQAFVTLCLLHGSLALPPIPHHHLMTDRRQQIGA